MQRQMCVILLLILLVPVVSAVWDPKEMKFTEGASESVGPFMIRLDEVDVMSKSAFVTVSKAGKVLGSGPITTSRPFILPNKVAVQLSGFSKVYNYGTVAKTNVSLWVNGKIASWRFPKTMSLFDNIHYNAYLIVENNGVAPTSYRTEIVQEGVYLAQKDKYQLEDGREVSRVLDIDMPVRSAKADAGEAVRVDYKEISANYRQHRGHYEPDRSAGVMLNLYYKNVLLDSVQIPDVTLTSVRSAGILDILVPDAMAQDNAYEGVAEMINGGYDDTATQRSKFNLELRTKGFELADSLMGDFGRGVRNDIADVTASDIIRGTLLRGEPQSWKFRITPHVAPGRYVLTFVLTGRKDGGGTNLELDRVDIPVQVTKGFLTRIERVDAPKVVEFGEKIPLTVSINNVGLGRMVLLKLISPVIETSTQKIIQLPGYQVTDVPFEAEALVTDKVPFSVQLLTHYAVGNKNFDPSGEDQYVLDQRAFSVGVSTPGEVKKPISTSTSTSSPVAVETPPPAPEPVPITDTILPPTPLELLPPVEAIAPPVVSPPVQTDAWMAALGITGEYLPWILLVVAVILLILGVKIIWDAYNIEDIEDEVTPIENEKGKKRSKK